MHFNEISLQHIAWVIFLLIMCLMHRNWSRASAYGMTIAETWRVTLEEEVWYDMIFVETWHATFGRKSQTNRSCSMTFGGSLARIRMLFGRLHVLTLHAKSVAHNAKLCPGWRSSMRFGAALAKVRLRGSLPCVWVRRVAGEKVMLCGVNGALCGKYARVNGVKLWALVSLNFIGHRYSMRSSLWCAMWPLQRRSVALVNARWSVGGCRQ